MMRAKLKGKFVIALLIFFVLTSFANAECYLEHKTTGKKFRIFDALIYNDVPPLNGYCFEPINVMYAWEFFPRGYENGELTLPTNAAMENAILKIEKERLPTVVDIEHWPLKNVSQVERNKSINNYLFVIDRLKDKLPNISIGYYGVIPLIDFSRAIRPSSDGRYISWTKDNDAVKSIANRVDATFPSLYTVNSNRQDWINRALAHIKEAKRLAPDKPVYPFIWPNYHEQGGKYDLGTEIEPDYWRTQLNFLAENADGFVLWGGNKQTFDESMVWWQETVNFVNNNFTKLPKSVSKKKSTTPSNLRKPIKFQ